MHSSFAFRHVEVELQTRSGGKWAVCIVLQFNSSKLEESVGSLGLDKKVLRCCPVNCERHEARTHNIPLTLTVPDIRASIYDACLTLPWDKEVYEGDG